MPVFKKAAIVGTGLIGGSLGLALKNSGGVKTVTGCAKHKRTAAEAVRIGAIDSAFNSCEEAVKGADIVFLATPVHTVIPEAKKVLRIMKRGSLLTDTASVKGGLVETLEELAAARKVRYIGGHPMAGSEMSGISAANKDLFVNAAYILTPTKRTDPTALKDLNSLLTGIGARVFTLDPERHDRVVAAISHLPHVVSASLVNVAGAEKAEFPDLFKVAGGGFYDTTRIAGSSPDLWVDIVMENRDAIRNFINQYQAELETIAELVDAGDAEGLKIKLENARRVRQDLPRLKADELEYVLELTVVVPNHPKVLSDITRTVADLSVNIEDIQIVHSTEADSGLLKLSILNQDDARRVSAALESKGYQLSMDRRIK